MKTRYYAEQKVAEAEALALTRSGYVVTVTDTGNQASPETRWFVVAVKA